MTHTRYWVRAMLALVLLAVLGLVVTLALMIVTSAKAEAATVKHVVIRGETAWQIYADVHGSPVTLGAVRAMLVWNGIADDRRLPIGKVLTIEVPDVPMTEQAAPTERERVQLAALTAEVERYSTAVDAVNRRIEVAAEETQRLAEELLQNPTPAGGLPAISATTARSDDVISAAHQPEIVTEMPDGSSVSSVTRAGVGGVALIVVLLIFWGEFFSLWRKTLLGVCRVADTRSTDPNQSSDPQQLRVPLLNKWRRTVYEVIVSVTRTADGKYVLPWPETDRFGSFTTFESLQELSDRVAKELGRFFFVLSPGVRKRFTNITEAFTSGRVQIQG